LCLADLYFLLRYGTNRTDVENHWVLERCQEVQASPDGYLDLWAREHYKSTIITFGLTIQDILRSHTDPDQVEETVCILSHNRPTAKAFLRQIKREFEDNEFLKELFPDVLYTNPRSDSPKWSEDEGIVVKRKSNPRESTIEAFGLVDGMPTGRHYRTLVYDDVVTERSVTTPDMISKTTTNFWLSLNLGVDGGKKRFIGTRYDSEDTYQHLLDSNFIKPRIYPATHNGQTTGKSVLISEEYLNEKRKQGNYIFSCQMLQNPVPSESAYFEMDRIQRFSLADPSSYPKHLSIYGSEDCAVTEDGDWTVFGVFGVDYDNHIYVLDWWRDRVRTDQWIEAQIDLMKLHQPQLWFQEKGLIQKSSEPFLVKRMTERMAHVTREPIAVTRNKSARARSIQGRVQMEMLHIPNDIGWADDLLLEMNRFPFSTVDDQVDCLSLVGLGLERLHGPMLHVEKPELDITTGKSILDAIIQTQKISSRYA